MDKAAKEFGLSQTDLWRRLKKLRRIKKRADFIKAMKTNLRMTCASCGHWNRVSVNKIFIEQETPEPKVKAYIPMYEPLEVSNY